MALVEEIKENLTSAQYREACDNLKSIYESETQFAEIRLAEIITCMLHNDGDGTIVYSEERRERYVHAKVVDPDTLTLEDEEDGRMELLMTKGICTRSGHFMLEPGASGIEWADHVCIVRVVIAIDHD